MSPMQSINHSSKHLISHSWK